MLDLVRGRGLVTMETIPGPAPIRWAILLLARARERAVLNVPRRSTSKTTPSQAEAAPTQLGESMVEGVLRAVSTWELLPTTRVSATCTAPIPGNGLGVGIKLKFI